MMKNEAYIVDCDFGNPDHLNGLCKMMNGYIEDEMGGGQPLNKLQLLRLVDGLNNHPTAIVLLAAVDGEAAGLIVAFENFSTFTVRPMINIHDVFVAPEYRKNGIGRMLMNTLEEKAKEKKCSRITLEVRNDNIKAQLLYKDLGFESTDPQMFYWRKNL